MRNFAWAGVATRHRTKLRYWMPKAWLLLSRRGFPHVSVYVCVWVQCSQPRVTDSSGRHGRLRGVGSSRLGPRLKYHVLNLGCRSSCLPRYPFPPEVVAIRDRGAYHIVYLTPPINDSMCSRSTAVAISTFINLLLCSIIA